MQFFFTRYATVKERFTQSASIQRSSGKEKTDYQPKPAPMSMVKPGHFLNQT